MIKLLSSRIFLNSLEIIEPKQGIHESIEDKCRRIGRILLIPDMPIHEHSLDSTLNRGHIEDTHSPLSSCKILLVSRGEESPDQNRYGLAWNIAPYQPGASSSAFGYFF